MRIRSIRPEFWTSEDIAALDWDTRLIYIGLWSYVDDNGVGRDVPRLIASSLFPLDDDTHGVLKKVSEALKLLTAGGQIDRYEVDRKPFLYVKAWKAHQVINRPSKGRYPLPTCENAVPAEPDVSTHATLTEPSRLGEGEKGRRGEGEKAPSRRAPETPLPDDWQPNVKHRTYATTNGLDVEREAFKFRNHAKANDRRQRQWDATFTTWLAKATEFKPKQSPRAERTDLPECWR